MKNEFVTVEKDGEIAVLALNRPDKRNASSIRVRDEVEKCLGELEEDENVKVVIITGVGSAFWLDSTLTNSKSRTKSIRSLSTKVLSASFKGF